MFFPYEFVAHYFEKRQRQNMVRCNRAIWALPALQENTDGGQVYTAHMATPFIQHADMRSWKFPLCRDRSFIKGTVGKLDSLLWKFSNSGEYAPAVNQQGAFRY